jgi:hypothetical protein
MEAFTIEGSYDCPAITLDKENNLFEISGRSLPEDVVTFYEPVIDWLNEYMKDPNPETIFDFKFIYFNTASSKVILDILTLFEEMIENDHQVKVRWYFNEYDEDMQEAGEEYAEMVEVPFEILQA